MQNTYSYMDTSTEQSLVNTLTTISPLFDAGPGGSYQPTTPGFLYTPTNSAYNAPIPLSYWATNSYLYNLNTSAPPKKSFDVVDQYDPNNYTLTPLQDTPDHIQSAAWQVERVNIANGIDIYDGATYQIALALANKNGLSSQSSSFSSLIAAQNALLNAGSDGNSSPASVNPNGNRGYNSSQFTYGGQAVSPDKAYFFRLITQNWCSVDPFKFSPPYLSYISQKSVPAIQPQLSPCDVASNPCYALGNITWVDWKPITGENVWAFYLGPMQSILISNTPVSPNDPIIVNATNLLSTLKLMQSPITGGIYYAAKGCLDNRGNNPVDPTETSTENNASCIAGLLAFRQVLKIIGGQDSTIATIDQIIIGNGTYNQPGGILGYFKNHAWNSTQGFFYQGGTEVNGEFVPNLSPNAVDVNTWGVTALGPKLIDQWFGTGAAYNCWNKVKSWGGFYDSSSNLVGVGYSDQDGGGINHPGEGICSAEWTFGAITMVRTLKAYYGDTYPSLAADEAAMLAGVESLRSDNYVNSPYYTAQIPPNYTTSMPTTSPNLSYLYASKRYFIPFGWYANPLPSLCSTSWAIMVNHGFNPFSYTGDYNVSPVISAYTPTGNRRGPGHN